MVIAAESTTIDATPEVMSLAELREKWKQLPVTDMNDHLVIKIKGMVTWTVAMELDPQEQTLLASRQRLAMALPEDMGPELMALAQTSVHLLVQRRPFLLEDKDMDLEACHLILLQVELDKCDLGLPPRKRQRSGGIKIPASESQ